MILHNEPPKLEKNTESGLVNFSLVGIQGSGWDFVRNRNVFEHIPVRIQTGVFVEKPCITKCGIMFGGAPPGTTQPSFCDVIQSNSSQTLMSYNEIRHKTIGVTMVLVTKSWNQNAIRHKNIDWSSSQNHRFKTGFVTKSQI